MNSPRKLDSETSGKGIPESTLPPNYEWQDWGEQVRRRNLSGLVAWLLDAARPVAFISAQLLYMGSPFIGVGAQRIAGLLESDEAADAFADYLRADHAAGSPRPRGRS
jgi:hypothetical protein